MKTILKKITLLSFTVLVVSLVSCKGDDDSSGPAEVNFSSENTALAAQTDNIVEGAQNIVEGGYVQIEEPGRMPNSIFPECTAFTITTNGNGGTILLDFGTACTLYNGAIVSGKISMEYGPIVAGTRSIDYVYVDFVYNGNAISGGGNINRTIENNNGNPQSTVSEDITISFPGSTVTANRDGLRITEWIEGVGSGNWDDNVYSITGTWQTTLSNGFERTGEVTIPLIRKLTCLYFVSGRIEVTQEGLTGELDFGNGTCDALATIIFNGVEYPVILGN
jgi:hypothetical protein